MFYTQDSYEATIGLNDRVHIYLPHDNTETDVLNGIVTTDSWNAEQLHKHFNK
jgi:hypothetical protein